MPERISSQSEDPLPVNGEYSHRYYPEPKGTLGEVVVTDPRDPFVWLATEISKIHETPSKNGKQLLWFIYRLNGNMPQTESDIKWRDDREDIDTILKNISRTDIEAADRYIEHLVRLDAEAAVRYEHLAPQSTDKPPAYDISDIKMHEPNSELILAAIMQHLELIDKYPKQS